MEQDKMTQRSRRRVLIKAVHDAAIELAKRVGRARYATAQLDDTKPTADEIRAAATIESRKICFDIIEADELWTAYAINSVSGGRHAGVGRTATEAKACAWINSHWPGGTTSALVAVSTEVPAGWTFELYPPPKPKETIAISALAIFELVRLTIPNVTPDEVQDAIMQSLPSVGGQRQRVTSVLERRGFES